MAQRRTAGNIIGLQSGIDEYLTATLLIWLYGPCNRNGIPAFASQTYEMRGRF